MREQPLRSLTWAYGSAYDRPAQAPSGGAMTPEPGPRPYAALGCFAAGIFALLAFVVLGKSAGSHLFLPAFLIILVALVLVLVRILARRR